MKKLFFFRLLLAATGFFAVSSLSSCTYVVQPEDIQKYLAEGADLTINLPAGSSFDLVKEDGTYETPCDQLSAPDVPKSPAEPADSTKDSSGNGEKKFRHAGAFVQQAFASGAYTCPSTCQIIIRTPQ
ncbi:MAG: hypothetical protein IPO83_00805 [Chitinophagaceae bacterium]|nr:hypothetical protein [Chitinophagaceae bacterium]